MKPTRTSLLLTIALVGLLGAVTVSRTVLATSGALISVRPATPIATAVMCGALLWWTIIVRRRLTHIQRAKHEEAQRARGAAPAAFVMQDKPLHPLVAARTIALAFAASRAGAWVAGWYFGIALAFSGHLESDDVRARLVYASLTALLSLVIVATALWLERSCKLPPPPPGAEATLA